MLTKLWRFLFGACEHKWATIHEADVYAGSERPAGWQFILRCEKCGNVKSKYVEAGWR